MVTTWKKKYIYIQKVDTIFCSEVPIKFSTTDWWWVKSIVKFFLIVTMDYTSMKVKIGFILPNYFWKPGMVSEKYILMHKIIEKNILKASLQQQQKSAIN